MAGAPELPAARGAGWRLGELGEAAAMFEEARDRLGRAVHLAREAGWSWESIAEATALDVRDLRRRYGPGRPRAW